MGIMDNVFGKKDDDKEPKRADFSNVQSGSSSTAPAPQPGIDRPAVGAERTYTVKSGDTLSKIAKREYGDANAWHRIYEANRDLIKNPDLIHPGWELKLPASSSGGR